MKKLFTMAVIAVLSVVSFPMCKDHSGTGTQGLTYVISIDGAVIKKSADRNAGSICVVPFGSPIELSGKGDSTGTPVGWVKAKWESSEGWIRSDSTGDIRSLQDRLGIVFNTERSYLSENVNKSFGGMFSVTGLYLYTGGEMEPGAMIFLSNGVLALNTTIFSEKQQVNFLRYEFLSEGKLLKIYFGDDSRINFPEYRVVEEGNSTVFKINDEEKSITYQIKKGKINFFNWVFMQRM